MMDWNKGFEAAYYGTIVDRHTWRDTERFEIKNSSQITRSDTDLIEAADVQTDFALEGEQWIRLHMIVRQQGAAEHVTLFTGLASAPSREIYFHRSGTALECFSVLKPAEDVLLPRGYFVPADGDTGSVLERLLDVIPAPVEIDGQMPKMQSAIIAEQGETHLSMLYKILKTINRRIRIQGDGTVRITDKAAAPATRYDPLQHDGVEPRLALTHDWFSCPNVFRAVTDSESVTVYDDRQDSALSTVIRGREVWMEEANCKLNAGEGLTAYAKRRLLEEQSRGYELRYSRRYDPDITVSDLVELRYPAIGVNGIYKVKTQRIQLTGGCRTEEEVEYC